jgi:hypothetical protein
MLDKDFDVDKVLGEISLPDKIKLLTGLVRRTSLRHR